MVVVGTATDREISERAKLGEDEIDVIEEHMSWIWFRDRKSFKRAWQMARSIRAGSILVATAPSSTAYADRVVVQGEGRRDQGLTLMLSAHHVVGAE
jgi:hypothetical protein